MIVPNEMGTRACPEVCGQLTPHANQSLVSIPKADVAFFFRRYIRLESLYCILLYQP